MAYVLPCLGLPCCVAAEFALMLLFITTTLLSCDEFVTPSQKLGSYMAGRASGASGTRS